MKGQKILGAFWQYAYCVWLTSRACHYVSSQTVKILIIVYKLSIFANVFSGIFMNNTQNEYNLGAFLKTFTAFILTL